MTVYVATVHFNSPSWIEIQHDRLRRHLPADHEIWASLEGIDRSYARFYDRVLAQTGPHEGKLNHLAAEIVHVADDADLIMFCDGDAFPIAEIMGPVAEGLSKAPLMAIRRAENAGDVQPHPSFCVTSVATWKAIRGDWSRGFLWDTRVGPISDVGANLLRALELSQTPWLPILRSNRTNLHPLLFGVYGDIVYHHGAGFRGAVTRADLQNLPHSRIRPRVAARAADRVIQRRWIRRRAREVGRLSREVYEQISAGGDTWLSRLV